MDNFFRRQPQLAVKPCADKRCNLIECQIKYLVLCYTMFQTSTTDWIYDFGKQFCCQENTSFLYVQILMSVIIKTFALWIQPVQTP